MKLLGTPTSPYTRKARILLKAVKRPYDFVDTRTEAGAALLAEIAPLAKVPVLVTDVPGIVLADSSLITDWLWTMDRFALILAGWTLDPSDWPERALQAVVEGALDAAINRRYLRLDGFTDTGYIAKQGKRVERTLTWLEGRITFARPLGAAALSLGCGLDWIAFRDVVDLARWPGLAAFRDAWTSSGVGAGSEPHE